MQMTTVLNPLTGLGDLVPMIPMYTPSPISGGFEEVFGIDTTTDEFQSDADALALARYQYQVVGGRNPLQTVLDNPSQTNPSFIDLQGNTIYPYDFPAIGVDPRQGLDITQPQQYSLPSMTEAANQALDAELEKAKSPSDVNCWLNQNTMTALGLILGTYFLIRGVK
jgi:hypothetical protein